MGKTGTFSKNDNPHRMASLRYNLKRTTGRKSAIVAIVRHKKETMKVSTGISVEPERWDNKRQQVRPIGAEAKAMNETLQKLRDKIISLVLSLGRLPGKEELSPKTTGIFEAIEAQRRRLVSIGKARSSAESYQTLASNITRFHRDKQRKETSTGQIGETYITDLIAYMIEKNYADSHTGKMVGLLRTVLRRNKVKTDWHDAKNIKIRYPDMIYLDESELKALRELDLSKEKRLARVRDVFLAACYTGQRYSDLKQIGQDRGFVGITQQKTGEKVLIPVKPELEEILSRHPDGLPVPTNQEVNKTIKRVCRAAGIVSVERLNVYRGGKKEIISAERCEFVTCHTARRSFATNAILAGLPTEAVMRFTGHRNYKEFQKYIRASQQDVARRFKEHPFFT